MTGRFVCALCCAVAVGAQGTCLLLLYTICLELYTVCFTDMCARLHDEQYFCAGLQTLSAVIMLCTLSCFMFPGV